MATSYNTLLLLLLFITLSVGTAYAENCKYEIKIQTGYEGTDGQVNVKLYNVRRESVFFEDLDNDGVDDFERGNLDVFKVTGRCLEDPCAAEVFLCKAFRRWDFDSMQVTETKPDGSESFFHLPGPRFHLETDLRCVSTKPAGKCSGNQEVTLQQAVA